MQNPWLNLSLEDYEAHMNSPEVRQLGVLSELFRDLLELRRPRSIAILGVAGGNGLEHIDTRITKHIVAIDVNPRYLEAVGRRFSQLQGLELSCVDLTDKLLKAEPVELLHAALIFEHTGLGRCLQNAVSMVAPEGALSVVLQLPSKDSPDVGESPVTSVQNLASHFSLVDPAELRQKLQACHFCQTSETRRSLPAGKEFWTGIFLRQWLPTESSYLPYVRHTKVPLQHVLR